MTQFGSAHGKATLEQDGAGNWLVFIEGIGAIGLGEKKIHARNRALDFIDNMRRAINDLDITEREIFMCEKWKCPRCSFPENFLPNCANCDYRNPNAKPENK